MLTLLFFLSYLFKEEEVTGRIQFENVYFHYPSRADVKILRGLKMSVEPGKTLAIVGPSGSGKSTAIALVERFYKLPHGSSVLLDGNEIQSLRLSWLREQMSLVSQEPVLFDLSIADNIRYGANFREVSDEEVQEAAKLANIHNFIEDLPEVRERYNTHLLPCELKFHFYYSAMTLMLV